MLTKDFLLKTFFLSLFNKKSEGNVNNLYLIDIYAKSVDFIFLDIPGLCPDIKPCALC